MADEINLGPGPKRLLWLWTTPGITPEIANAAARRVGIVYDVEVGGKATKLGSTFAGLSEVKCLAWRRESFAAAGLGDPNEYERRGIGGVQ